MQGDYASIRLLLGYAGLDRQLNEPESEDRGLSEQASEIIRRALLGGAYEPEISGQRESNETPRAFAYSTAQSRPGEGNQAQGYQVGYRKPPMHTRFQKGHSGNPAGRPRVAKSFRTLTLQLFGEEVSITENGREQVRSRLQVIFTQIVNKAALGDSRFQALLLAYAPAMDIKLRHRRRLPKNAVEFVRKRLLLEI
jgi:Family of unknown function (DUF5681)